MDENSFTSRALYVISQFRVPMKTKKIKINGLNHQFYFWGKPNNPKLFFFHGWLDCAASFEFVCEYLEKDFYCIGVDMRGYGKSEWAKSLLGYFFYEYVADLHQVFEKFSPKDPVSIVGHSFGGAISSFYAGIFPERVKNFINLEGFAFKDNPPDRGPEKARSWMEGIHKQRFNYFKDIQHFAVRMTQANPRIPIEKAKFVSKFLSKKTTKGVIASADPLHKLAEPYVFTKDLFYPFWEKIQARCLLVAAELTEMNAWMKSDDLKKEIQERLDHFPKKSKVVEIKACGHMMHYEKPEEVAALVLKFLL